MHLAIVASHPIQYHAPLFRVLAQRVQLKVFFAHRATQKDQAQAGFGVEFEWDVDLVSGYEHHFLHNVAEVPGLGHFGGCDTPEIAQRLSEESFDAVLTLGWHLKAYVQTVFAAKRLGLPLSARGDSHLETPRSMLKKSLKALSYPAFLRLFDAALYVGERSRTYWRHYRYPETKLFFSPHCVDAAWFGERATLKSRHALRARFGISPNAMVALFAGKLVPFKRPFDVVAAAARMKSASRELEVLIAGAGPLGAEMEARARDAGVRLHLMGFLNQTDMPAAYAAADVLVLPSDGNETWGLVANEALACGRPVVLADTVGAAPDLAADGSAGRVFPVGDIGALVSALQQIFESSPTPQMIRAKSNAYGLSAAADGIERAVAATAKPGGVRARGPGGAKRLPSG